MVILADKGSYGRPGHIHRVSANHVFPIHTEKMYCLQSTSVARHLIALTQESARHIKCTCTSWFWKRVLPSPEQLDPLVPHRSNVSEVFTYLGFVQNTK